MDIFKSSSKRPVSQLLFILHASQRLALYLFCFIEVTLVYNIMSVSHLQPYISYFYIHHSMLTTKNLVSIHHHTLGFFYPFQPPTLSPAPSLLVTTTWLSIFICSFLFGLVCSFSLTKPSAWCIFSVKTSPATPIHFLYLLSHLLLALFYLPPPTMV